MNPQLIKKHQTHLTDEIERKIISMSLFEACYRKDTTNYYSAFNIHCIWLYSTSVSYSFIMYVILDVMLPLVLLYSCWGKSNNNYLMLPFILHLFKNWLTWVSPF